MCVGCGGGGGGLFSRCEVARCPYCPLRELSVLEGGREGPFSYSFSDCGCGIVLFVEGNESLGQSFLRENFLWADFATREQIRC